MWNGSGRTRKNIPRAVENGGGTAAPRGRTGALEKRDRPKTKRTPRTRSNGEKKKEISKKLDGSRKALERDRTSKKKEIRTP